MSENRQDKPSNPLPGEADTPAQAHDETAPEIRRLREGDDAPQTGARDDRA